MEYPENHPHIDHVDWGNLRIVLIADDLPVHATKRYKTRSEWSIRKIVIHHHAGWPRGTSPKRAKSPYLGVPESVHHTALNVFVNGKGRPAYSYHYDVGFTEEKQPGGRHVVYQTQTPDKIAYHTGGIWSKIILARLPNNDAVAVSHFGMLRTPNHFTPEKKKSRGRYLDDDKGNEMTWHTPPSPFQRAATPELVRYLQDKYDVSPLHVTGHFQFGKPTCPGWDFENWILEYQEQARRKGKAFCYPVALDGSATPPFLKPPDDSIGQARTYLENTREGGSGFYPFGRRFFWHNGVHLYPGKARAPVFAVRDGWVIGARFSSKVEVDGVDYGSSTFVLVQHEDPGLHDLWDDRTVYKHKISGKIRKFHRPLVYYSLYMHLEPIDNTLDWVKRLEARDSARYQKLVDEPDTARHVTPIAVPVSAGEIIGYVGQHNPFAGKPDDVPKDPADKSVFEAEHHHVLHFEMFARRELLKIFDPDTKKGGRWILKDTDSDGMATKAIKRLGKVKGFAGHETTMQEQVDELEKLDAKMQDPSLWKVRMEANPGLEDALSMLITEHISEWNAGWDSVVKKAYRKWGLSGKAAKNAVKVVNAFKWWKDLVKTETGYPARNTGLAAKAKPFHYHPIRLLNWLNGLERVRDAPRNVDLFTGLDDADRIYADMPIIGSRFLVRNAKKGDKHLFLKKSVDARRLHRGGALRFKKHSQVYNIKQNEAVERTPGDETTLLHYKVEIDPGLEKDTRRNTSLKIGTTGWHWEAKFDWETPFAP